MTPQPQPPEIDFRQVYADGTRQIPWDLGEPQPALAELVAAGWCRGAILDIGCGTGELSLALAARGHQVTGIDLAEGAVRLARHKAAERDLEATFHTGDATRLPGYDAAFDTVLDSGMLHCLHPDDQFRYLDVLRRICRPGAQVAVLCFADLPDARTPDGGRLSEEWLRNLFTPDWHIDELVPAPILGIIPDGIGAMSHWPRDDRGRTSMTGWRLRAHRRQT